MVTWTCAILRKIDLNFHVFQLYLLYLGQLSLTGFEWEAIHWSVKVRSLISRTNWATPCRNLVLKWRCSDIFPPTYNFNSVVGSKSSLRASPTTIIRYKAKAHFTPNKCFVFPPLLEGSFFGPMKLIQLKRLSLKRKRKGFFFLRYFLDSLFLPRLIIIFTQYSTIWKVLKEEYMK